jgi:polysaccharide export outer membrane protein
MSLRRVTRYDAVGRLAFAAVVAFALGVPPGSTGCASKPSPPPPDQGAADVEGPSYVIGPADVLRIQVWRNPELSAEVPVRPDGKISVPLLNDVQAAGLTTLELRDTIAAGIAEYVTAPDVTVMVSQVNSKMAYIVGEVARPTAIPLTMDMRVLDAIAAVGGFTPFADKNSIQILRRNGDGGVTEYRFNYPAFLKGRQPEGNMLLRPGDTIVVPD